MGKLKLFFACLLMAVLSIGQVWATGTCTLTSAQIKAGSGSTSYGSCSATDGCSKTWNAYAIKNQHSNATSDYHFWQIKKYASSTAYYVQVPEMAGNITQLKITVSGSSKARDGGSNTATLFFSNSNSTSEAGTGVASGTGASEVTIDCSSLNLATGYITTSAAVRIWDVEVTYQDGGEVKTLSSIAISGNPTKTSYYAGDDFDPAGLVVTGTYSDESTAPISSGITWSYNPSQTLALNQTSIGVTATVNSITSPEYMVSSLSVTEAPAAVNYELVTNVSELADAAEIIIVNVDEDKALSITQASKNRPGVAVTSDNHVIAVGDDVQVITLEASSTNWKFNVGDSKYLYASSSSANELKSAVVGTSGNNGVWSIAIADDGAATILAQGSNTRNFLRYNPNSGSPIFNCYASNSSTGTLVKIFKKVDGTVLPSAELAYADAQKLAKLGVAFTAQGLTNPHSVTVSYASDNTGVATVDPATGAVSIVAAGKAKVTATFAGNDDYKAGSASYTIFVAEQAGTNEDPLTEASAKALIDDGCTLTVHVNGIVLSQNSTNFTVTLTNGFQFYKAKDLNNVAFESAYLGAGDEVTAVGALKKFSSTYELDEGCYLTYYQQAATSLTPIANTKETAYSVATALGYAAEPLVYQLTDPIYIEGVVYKVENFNSTNGTLDIYIKDANADNEFELFKCKGIYDESLTAFTSADDVREGDQVIGYGVLKHFKNSTIDIWEFDNNATGDYLVSLVRPTIPVTDINLTESTASVAVGGHVTLHASVVPTTANNKTINWSVTSGGDKASVADGVVTGIAEGTAVIRAASDEDASIYAECTVTVTPLSPWASVYTSNIELSTEGGTSASAAKVKFDGEETEYAAIKAGVSGTAGAVVVNVPAQATELHLHAYGWNSEDVTLSITAPDGVTVTPASITLNRNSGFAGNSPFTLAEGSTPQYDAYYALSLSGNTDAIELTITATAGKRFLLFGVNQVGGVVLQSIAVSGTASVLEYTDGQHFDPTGLSVIGHYTDDSEAEITEDIVWAFDPDPLTEGTTSVSVTATAAGFTSAAFVVNGLTVAGAAPLSPWATTWTSNLDDITGSKVKFYGEETEYAALKAGSGNVAGTATLNIPAQATELHLHAYGWNSEDVTLSITAPDGVTVTPASITLNRNSGFANNSPFTLAEGSTPQYDAYYALSLSGNTDAIELTITATAGKRFLLFGVNQVGGVLPELQSIAISGDLTDKTYEAGQAIDPTGLTVEATYTLAGVPQTPVDITDDPNLEWSYDPLVKDQTSVTLTASFEGKNAQKTIEGLTVTEATPTITASPSFWKFNNVSKDAEVAAKTINVTLTNVATATVTLSGAGAPGYTVDKTALTESGTISITPVTTTLGSFNATITISDDAGVATDATITLVMTVMPVDEGDALLSGVWTLVTDASQLVDGSKVIIAQYVNADGAIRTMSTQNNNNRASVESTVAGTSLTPAEGTRVMTLEALAGGKYAFRTNINTYLYAASSSSNYLKEELELNDNGRWTISIEDGNKAVITATGTNSHRIMRYNEGSELFSCYESGQKDVQLFIRTVDYSRTDMFSPGVIGTVCVDHNVPFAGIEGATFYELAGLVSTGFIAFDEIVSGQLEAGVPYLFQANANELKLYYGTTTVPSPVNPGNGMYGTFDPIDVTENLDDVYYFAQHNFWSCSGMSSLHMPANRAYVRMSEVPSAAPNPNPGRRRVVMGVNGTNTTTGCENIESGNAPRKQLIDGAIYIIRGEKVYDTTGRLVK